MSDKVNNNILPSKPEGGSPLMTKRIWMILLCDVVFKLVYNYKSLFKNYKIVQELFTLKIKK